MLAIIADCYTPLLLLVAAIYLKPFTSWKLLLRFSLAYCYVTLLVFVEEYFGWWLSMQGNFSSHTAVALVLVIALLRMQLKVGVFTLVSLLAYGQLMAQLNYHTWFDILTTILVCLPCWWLFPSKKVGADTAHGSN
jgi:hypothetical protein